MSVLVFKAAVDATTKSLQEMATAASQSAAAVGNADVASNPFAKVLNAISQTAGFGILGEGMASGADLLQQLQDLIHEEDKARKVNDVQLLYMIEDSIKKTTQWIKDLAGPAGSQFSIGAFRRYIAEQDAATAAKNDAEAGGGIGVGAGVGVGAPITPAETTASGKFVLGIGHQARQIVDDTASEEKILGKTLDDLTGKLNVENALVESMRKRVDDTNAAITEGETTLEQMAEAAGVTDKTGAGSKVKDIGDKLKEAQERLQYLQDKGASKDDVSAAEKVITTLKAQLDDAQKSLRIATYEFEHSDAYKAQQKAIADAKAELVVRQKELEIETRRQQAAQQKVDEQKKALDAFHQKVTDGVKTLTDAANSVTNAATQAAKKITTAAAGFSGQASSTPNSPLTIYTGHAPAPLSFGTMLTTGAI